MAPNNALPTVDQILENLTAAPAGANPADAGIDKLIKLEELRRQERKEDAEREREQRREDREAARASDQMKMIIGLATTLLPMMNRGTDPALIAALTNRGSGEEMKSILEMQRQQAAAQQDMQLKSFMSIIAVKDELNKQVLSDVINRQEESDGGAGAGGVAGIMREVRLGLGAVGGILGGRQPAPVEVPALSPPTPDSQPTQQAPQQQQQKARQHPVVIILKQLKAMQEGKVSKPLVARAAMVTVALNDEGLIDALLSDQEDDVFAYCLPHVRSESDLVAWLQGPGVTDWLGNYLKNQLIPQVDMAVNGFDETESGDDKSEADMKAPVQASGQAIQL